MMQKIKKIKGFSLLELILVLGVGSMMTFTKFQNMKHEQDNVMAKAVGSQMKQIGEAVNGYISIRYDKLSTLAPSSSQSSDPGPRTCTVTGCEITYQTLVNEGLLPISYTGVNALNSSYKIVFQRSGNAPNHLINGLITTVQPWSDGGKTRYDLLGKAMQEAGIDSGMTQSPTQASGYHGTWNEKSADYPNINKEGLLAYRVGYDSSMYSVYLRRDGTLPMTGSLNMGGKNIVNAQDITATGTVTAGTLKSTGLTAVGGALTVAGTSTLTGAVSVGNNLTVAGTSNLKGATTLNSLLNVAGATNLKSTATVGSTLSVGGAINANNILTVAGSSTLKGATSLASTLSVAGASTLNGALTAKNVINASGNITSSGQVKGATIYSSGRLTANEYIQINKTASAGASCSPNGLQGKSSTGALLSCVSGKWVNSGATDVMTGMYSSNANGSCTVKNAATGSCSCSAGTKALMVSKYYNESCSGGANSNNCKDASTYIYACSR